MNNMIEFALAATKGKQGGTIIPVFWPGLVRAYLDLERPFGVGRAVPISLHGVNLVRPGVAKRKKYINKPSIRGRTVKDQATFR
jgi:hypothetical protein